MNTIAMTLQLEPEVKTAVEAVVKLIDVRDAVLWRLYDRNPDFRGAENHPLHRISVNSRIVTFVNEGLYEWQKDIPERMREALKRKEGLQQILNFLFDHPEIEYVTTEHFAKDDPAYELVEEEPDHFPPIDRSIAAGRLAGEEELLKAASAALSAINRVEELFKDPFEDHELIEDDAKLAG